jgi:hypothetical protein
MFNMVVGGLVPDYLRLVRVNKKRVKAKSFENCSTENIIENQIMNHSKSFKTVQCKTLTVQCKTLIYNHAIILPTNNCHWNKMSDSVQQAKTVDGFKSAVFHLYKLFSPIAYMLKGPAMYHTDPELRTDSKV